ncbi:metallophosphoesterase [Paenarthrobacter sp. DKR-5]|uniref:metallophosphoesterase n=1 Tax=Paenarthrobacter sp. DKR-5 TaxID=2835535 RepID=UPI001BDCFA09|nr:metallophosphoesterase [Paenarthrobacter sp. DKR-5]MBT1002307.1 metallophosphoesterase [Paenarthrobacter sp. DKR-5]
MWSHPEPGGLRILHLSDTHLLAGGALHAGTVDTVSALRTLLASLQHLDRFDLLVASGDVSDDGSAASYRTARDLLEDFARPRGARVVFAMGNHDERTGFRSVLGNGHPGSAPEPAGTGPVCGVSTVAGYRIISVDSSVPGRTHGLVEQQHLAWLRGRLARPSERGTVLVVHHPPVEPLTPLHHGIDLQNRAELVAALAGSDVRLVLSGHYHHHLADAVEPSGRPVPVVVTAGVVNVNDVLAAPGHERALATSGAAAVTLRADGRVRVAPLRLESARPVFDLDPAGVEELSRRIRA